MQSETFIEQQKITKIEQETIELDRRKSKNAARPIFKVDHNSELHSDESSLHWLHLNLGGNNPATHVIFKPSNKNYCGDLLPQEMMNPGDSIPIPLTNPSQEMFYDGVTTLVSFTYLDYIGNEYEQFIWLLKKKVELSPPYDAI